MSTITTRDENILGGGVYCRGLFFPLQTPAKCVLTTAGAYEEFNWPKVPKFLAQEYLNPGTHLIAHNLLVERQVARQGIAHCERKRGRDQISGDGEAAVDSDASAVKRLETNAGYAIPVIVNPKSAEFKVAESPVVEDSQIRSVHIDSTPVETTPAEKSVAEKACTERASTTTGKPSSDKTRVHMTAAEKSAAEKTTTAKAHIKNAPADLKPTENASSQPTPAPQLVYSPESDFSACQEINDRQKAALAEELDVYEKEAEAYMVAKRLDPSNRWILSAGRDLRGYRPSSRGGLMKPSCGLENMEWYRIQKGEWNEVQKERLEREEEEEDEEEEDGKDGESQDGETGDKGEREELNDMDNEQQKAARKCKCRKCSCQCLKCRPRRPTGRGASIKDGMVSLLDCELDYEDETDTEDFEE